MLCREQERESAREEQRISRGARVSHTSSFLERQLSGDSFLERIFRISRGRYNSHVGVFVFDWRTAPVLKGVAIDLSTSRSHTHTHSLCKKRRIDPALKYSNSNTHIRALQPFIGRFSVPQSAILSILFAFNLASFE